jgi:hypothetical protein
VVCNGSSPMSVSVRLTRRASSLVEHWLFGSPDRPGSASTATPPREWSGNAGRAGWGVRAHCWVLRKRTRSATWCHPAASQCRLLGCGCGGTGCVWACVFSDRGTGLFVIPACRCRCEVGTVGVWWRLRVGCPVCCL